MNNTNKRGCQNPKCSHNTNGRDLDKPCSIEFRPPQNSSAAVEEVVREFLALSPSTRQNNAIWLRFRLTKLTEEARADMKAKCLELINKQPGVAEIDICDGAWLIEKRKTIAAIQALPISNE